MKIGEGRVGRGDWEGDGGERGERRGQGIVNARQRPGQGARAGQGQGKGKGEGEGRARAGQGTGQAKAQQAGASRD